MQRKQCSSSIKERDLPRFRPHHIVQPRLVRLDGITGQRRQLHALRGTNTLSSEPGMKPNEDEESVVTANVVRGSTHARQCQLAEHLPVQAAERTGISNSMLPAARTLESSSLYLSARRPISVVHTGLQAE